MPFDFTCNSFADYAWTARVPSRNLYQEKLLDGLIEFYELATVSQLRISRVVQIQPTVLFCCLCELFLPSATAATASGKGARSDARANRGRTDCGHSRRADGVFRS